MIHHLSYPKGSSVNDGIDSEHTRVCYATVDHAIKFIKLAGPGCFLAKTDIKNAFRIIPISPDDYNLLGMQWRGLYYYDRFMPMGCSSSCLTFETFSTAVEWIARQRLSIAHILHLLDDFLIVASSATLCQAQLDLFLNSCSYLGIPMAPEKTCGPATTLSFAGIELDSILSEARLPLDKIDKSRNLISAFLARKKVSLTELQSLTGLLNFACSVIKPGRAFLRRLIDLTIGVRSPHHLIRLNKEVKEDLKVWLSFLTDFNDDVWQNSVKLSLYTDASGALGFGEIFGSKWCYGKWPVNWAHSNIAILEFYPIVLSLYLWGHEMSHQCVLFFTDNEALVDVINKQSCKDKICQFQAMCSIAFHAFLRVGEMTSTTGLGPRPLQIHQVVQLVNDSNTIVSLKIVFEDFKHSYNQSPSSMVINRVPIFCPVQLMLDYLALRGNKPGPSLLHYMVIQFLEPILLISCLWRLNSVGSTLLVIRDIVFGLGLHLMLQIGVCLMPRYEFWAGGSLMLFIDIFAFLLYQRSVFLNAVSLWGYL